MGQKEVEQLKQFMKEMNSGGPQGVLQQQFSQMQGYLNHLDNGLAQLGGALQHISMEVNMCRLTHQMLFNMLKDAEIYSEEEIQERYVKEVAEPIQKATQELQEKIQKANKEFEAAQKEKEIMNKQKEDKDEGEMYTDIVLPSEKHKVISFDERKKDKK